MPVVVSCGLLVLVEPERLWARHSMVLLGPCICSDAGPWPLFPHKKCILCLQRWRGRAQRSSASSILSELSLISENDAPPPRMIADIRVFWKELSGPVLRDTARLSQRYPPIARYGFFGVSTWPIGCDTPSPFSQRFPLGEHAKWRCDTPPPVGGQTRVDLAILAFFPCFVGFFGPVNDVNLIKTP